MRIALFSDTFLPQINGVSSVVATSADALAKRGHEVYVFTVSDGLKNPESHTIIPLFSVPALVYPGYRLAMPFGKYQKVLQQFKPDIIHTHTPFTVGWAAVFGKRRLQIPLVGTHHTYYDHYLKHVKFDTATAQKLSWKYVINYYNNCDLISIPSRSLADDMQKYGLKSPLRVLSNPVDTYSFCPPENQNIRNNLKSHLDMENVNAVYMGRLSYEKSIDQVIKAVSEVIKHHPEFHLLIVGDGPDRQELERLVAKLGIGTNIRFLGLLRGKELVESLQLSDMFLTASKTENMPVSVLEAIAVGLPVIAVNALGLPELIKDGINGYLVRQDDPVAMSEKILLLYENRELREKYSLASRSFAERYSLENFAQALEQQYQDALA